MVPLTEGRFDLDDYVDYVIEMLHVLGGNMHVIAVCQPSVPVVAAVSIMEAENDPYVPISMTLMGGPIDTRRQSDGGQQFAAERGIDWFRQSRHHQGTVSASRRDARRLSGLPAAQRLHQHESRPPHGRPQGSVPEPW